MAATDVGTVALCGGAAPDDGLCLRRCPQDECARGEQCIAGVCSPEQEAAATVALNPAVHYQSLIGFGAGVAYAEDAIVAHPDKAALYRAMFSDLGLDALRFRNRVEHGTPDLAAEAEIVLAASASLGRAPTVLIASWSPPAALKANGTELCEGNPDTCTLVQTVDGGFDYAGFASYWRRSLEAYAGQGVFPDYVSMQGNPNWVPATGDPSEACRFLPVEGTDTVTVGDATVEVAYPGLVEALGAVAAEFATLPSPPALLAPDVSGIGNVAEYADVLDFSGLAALSHHLYGTDLASLDLQALRAAGELAARNGVPVFQTELQAEGFDTAIWLHQTLSVEGVSMFLQYELVTTNPDGNPRALAALGSEKFTLQDPYHALRHYAFHTDPGWIRVEATPDQATLLATAWLSPEEDELTLVLVNTADVSSVVRLDLGSWATQSSSVMRSVFPGIERSAELGALPDSATLELPARAVATVALTR